MNQRCMIPVIKTAKDYQTYRIKPEDTNRVAIVFDPDSANDSLTVCVEIFDPEGATPPHRHNFAVEIFLSLKEKAWQSVMAKKFHFIVVIVY